MLSSTRIQYYVRVSVKKKGISVQQTQKGFRTFRYHQKFRIVRQSEQGRKGNINWKCAQFSQSNQKGFQIY